MKIRKAVLTLVGLLISAACQKQPLSVYNSDITEEDISYAIGQQIGQTLKAKGVQFKPEAVLKALKDAQAGTNDFTPEKSQQAMMALQELMIKQLPEQTVENEKTAREFLEKNKRTAGVKVTSSGLQYLIEKEGVGPRPSANATVRVEFKGSLLNGDEFDSSLRRGGPVDVQVKSVVQGWAEALQMMNVGSKYKLFIPPHLGMGPLGQTSTPPNSVLILEVELVEIVKDGKKADQKKTASL